MPDPDLDALIRRLIAAVAEETVRLTLSDPSFVGDWPAGKLAVREDEVPSVIAVKKTTLRDLRLKGLLPSRKVGNSHFYLREDLLNLLNRPGD